MCEKQLKMAGNPIEKNSKKPKVLVSLMHSTVKAKENMHGNSPPKKEFKAKNSHEESYKATTKCSVKFRVRACKGVKSGK